MRTQASFFEIGKKSELTFHNEDVQLKKAYEKMFNIIFQCESEVAQSCLTLCNPVDCSPTRLLCPWGSPGKNTGEGCHFLLQGIFLTWVSNPGLLHCRQTL